MSALKRLSQLRLEIRTQQAVACQAVREIARLTSGYPSADLWDDGIAAVEDVIATATANAEILRAKAHCYREEGRG